MIEAITFSLPVSIGSVRKDRVALIVWLQDKLSQAGLRITGPYEGRYHIKGLIALTLRFPTLPPHRTRSSTRTGRNGLAAEAPAGAGLWPISCLRSSILTPHTSRGWSSRKCMDSNREARPDPWALVNCRRDSKDPQFQGAHCPHSQIGSKIAYS